MIEAGFLVVDKPEGLTSQRVVGKIKRLLDCRKVGHTGTLDPLATGVLPIALNRATRLIQYLDESRKIYSGEIELGVESDTLDRDGEVVARHAGSLDFDKAEIAAVFARYHGRITQVAPVYSAIKSKGRPLYAYARAGIEVKPPERQIEIDSFTLLSYNPPLVKFLVVCSKGTYVRSLAADVGRDLGCGGRIWSLRREASGSFTLDQAITLDALHDLVEVGGELPLLSPLEVLDHLPRLQVTDLSLKNKIAHGMALPVAEWPETWSNILSGIEPEVEILLVDEAEKLMALARFNNCLDGAEGFCGLRMSRVLLPAGSG
ncbi:MAG: tRNA pseudouridine(55) synthase TruB [Deltaproteobacteria bacterium]|nr:tRNA pseudouridine(55) synthase TruB [Deltaproteobacteria bacterium]